MSIFIILKTETSRLPPRIQKKNTNSGLRSELSTLSKSELGCHLPEFHLWLFHCVRWLEDVASVHRQHALFVIWHFVGNFEVDAGPEHQVGPIEVIENPVEVCRSRHILEMSTARHLK